MEALWKDFYSILTDEILFLLDEQKVLVTLVSLSEVEEVLELVVEPERLVQVSE